MFTPMYTQALGDKEKFLKHFIRFKQSGYKWTLFHRWFYIRLSFMFGHIAHCNRHGFYDHWFATPEAQAEFLENIRTWRPCGDPEYTYVDVERYIQRMI